MTTEKGTARNTSRLRRTLSRKNYKRFAAAIVLLMLLGLISRNAIGRYVASSIGSQMLATRVDIGSVEIGWYVISVNDVEVHEPKIENERQLTVKRISAVPTLWQGLQTGVWFSEVTVHSPTAEVRFDQDGNLLSVFPQGGSENKSAGSITIPVAKVTVKDAVFKVHQIGRDSLVVKDVDVGILANDRIKAVVMIPDLIGSHLKIQCDVDAVTLEGASVVSLDSVHLDTVQLAHLPLVPVELASERVVMDCGLKIVARHPANEFDLRSHSLHMQAWTRNVNADRLGELCERFDLEIKNDNGSIAVAATANPLEGKFTFRSSVDLMAKMPVLTIESSLQGCRPELLSGTIPELAKLQTNAIASTRWSVVLDQNNIRFQGNVRADVTDSSFDSVDLPVIRASVEANGGLAINDPKQLSGTISGTMVSETVDLETLARSLDLPPAIGEVTSRSEFTVPLDSIADVGTYNAAAKLKVFGVAMSELHMDDAVISASLRDGVARVDVEGFTIRDTKNEVIAEAKSTTTVGLREGGRLESASQLFVEPSLEIIRLLGIDSVDPRGRMLANISASCPVDFVTSPEAWKANTRLQTQALSGLGETISDIDWQATLTDGKIACNPLEARWRGHAISVNASGKVGPTIALRGDASLDALRLAELSEILSRYSTTKLPADGLATIQGSFAFHKNLRSGERGCNASGSANLTQASYAGNRIGEANVQWSANFDGVTVATSSPDFLGGRFDVSAKMSELDWSRTHIEGNFAGVEASRLVAITGQTIPVTGTLSGGFRVTSIASVDVLTGDAWLGNQQLSVKKLPLQISQATVGIKRGELSLNATGSVVDGTFTAQAGGSLPQLIEFFEREAAPFVEIPLTAQVRLSGLRTESLVRPLGLPREALAVTARLSAQCTRDLAATDGRNLCLASATVEDLRYNHQGLSQRMSIDTVLHANRMEVASIRGRFADGEITGSGSVRFEQTPTGHFDVSASRVNLRRATSPLGVKNVSGTGTVRLRGRIGPVITGQLDAAVNNLAAGGVAIRKATFPVDWSYRPSANLARWQCRAGTVSVGGGNVRIAAKGSYNRGWNANTSVLIEKVDLAKLMQNGSAGAGVLNGQAHVRAKNARAVDDLVGSFAFVMQNIQAMQIPVLDQLPKMITLSPPVPGRGQDGGTIRGRIAGGLVHLDEVAIHQSNVQMLLTGNATMKGKLNLDVVASTESESPTDQLVLLLDSPLMLAAPAPIGLIVKANEMLKDRVVRVHIGGTADRPTLQLQPGKQLSQNAVRFFLSNSFGPGLDRISDAQSKYQRR